jgi:hypothetical protein
VTHPAGDHCSSPPTRAFDRGRAESQSSAERLDAGRGKDAPKSKVRSFNVSAGLGANRVSNAASLTHSRIPSQRKAWRPPARGQRATCASAAGKDHEEESGRDEVRARVSPHRRLRQARRGPELGGDQHGGERPIKPLAGRQQAESERRGRYEY